MSMDAQDKYTRSGEHGPNHYANDRYEHYSAEYEEDEPDYTTAVQDTDVVTPLATDKVTTGESTETSHRTPEHVATDDKDKLRNASIRYAAPSSTSLSLEGYFSAHQPRSSLSSRRALGPHVTSNPSSSGSLHALSEHEGIDALQSSVRRAISTKSISANNRMRSASQSKATSSSQPNSKRPSYGDQLVYPDQSLASLQTPVSSTRPHPILRTRSSHPAQNSLYGEVSRIHRAPPNSGVRTADNTPMSSPGLFSPTSIRPPNLSDGQLKGFHLHHLQTPKETHTAEIEHDVYSGNKFINNYEVVRELGRGEHGKVKLGRDIERNNHCVAIKIVPRWSAKRRLGKLGAPEDITKREVAILKKARHPNVVSLLEVIDDPSKNKVYLILEFVEKGEIKWRKHGVKEVLAINNQRFDQQKLGITLSTEPTDRDAHVVHLAHMRHERLEQMRNHNQILSHVPNWSLEYAGETDDESEMSDVHRTMSRQWSHVGSPIRGNSQDDHTSPNHEPSLSGSMYGSYMPEPYRNRKFSVAASAISHMSSEMNFDLDDDQRSYVPALTLEEARGAFRDTLLGLEFLHFIGIIHRDIKPANLLVSGSGSVKISDFGVSYLGRPITEEDSENRLPESEASPLDDEKELARSVGTPAFWAPELCHNNTDMFVDGKEPKITGALDLWALGITLYCMIYARLPFYHNESMGLHEAVCTTEVFCPKTRLVPVNTTNSEHIAQAAHATNSDKRLDYELKFEHVPDALRELIQKLLTKDPAYRITISEAKKHPWVTQGMSDTEEFLQNPEIAKEGKKKILEISDKEVDRAVVKRNFIDKISTTAGRIVGSLLGRKDSRKRASTNASSAGSSSESLHSPAGSSTSTVGKADKARESRRASLRGDELLQALKASRDPSEHHPLSQSQTASPDSDVAAERSSSPGYFDHNTKAASTGATPGPEYERLSRPRGPDRAVSALSTADSVKTIRASHQHRTPISDLMLTSEALHNEPSLRARVEGLWEGTTKTIHRFASRDRRHGSSRSRSNSRPPSENDGHAGPSLAVTNTCASGAIQTPNVLRGVDRKKESFSSTSLSHQVDELRSSPIRVPSSDNVAWERAQQMNQRRQVQEIMAKSDPLASPPQDDNAESCPPSPDDLIFRGRSEPPSAQMSPYDMTMGAISTAISASTIASSLDAYDNSSVSHSVSNPSIGLVSGASSPPGENPLLDDYNKRVQYEPTAHTHEVEPDFMRTADTVTFHGRPTTPTAVGKPLQDEHEYFDDGDDETDSSDEEGIVMGSMRRN